MTACLAGPWRYSRVYDSKEACSEPLSFTQITCVLKIVMLRPISFIPISLMFGAIESFSSSAGKDKPDLKIADVIFSKLVA